MFEHQITTLIIHLDKDNSSLGTLKKKEVRRTPQKGSVDLKKHLNVSKVSKKG